MQILFAKGQAPSVTSFGNLPPIWIMIMNNDILASLNYPAVGTQDETERSV